MNAIPYNCLDPPKLTDGTELAQKLLSTILKQSILWASSRY